MAKRDSDNMVKWEQAGKVRPSDRNETKHRIFMEIMGDVYGEDVERRKSIKELIELHPRVAEILSLKKPSPRKSDDGFADKPKKGLSN
jgi:hypothetical protein